MMGLENGRGGKSWGGGQPYIEAQLMTDGVACVSIRCSQGGMFIVLRWRKR